MIDPAIEGMELSTIRFPVERGKLAELARALHEEDPAWHDSGAATAAGFAQLPVPPTVTALVDHWRAGGPLADVTAIGIDARRLLHGEAAWEYLAPVRVGDELTAVARVAGVSRREGRRGGAMTFVTIETEFTNQHAEPVVRRRDTLIETEAA